MAVQEIRVLAPTVWAAIAALSLSGCDVNALLDPSGKKAPNQGGGLVIDGAESDDSGEDMSPEEKTYLATAQPFCEALSKGQFAEAYDMLGPTAVHDVSPFQFLTPDEPGDGKPLPEPPRIAQLSKDQFVAEMEKVAAHYGQPHSIATIYVNETDSEVLSGKGDKVSALFSIGMIPASVPAEQRKAAVRAQIRCRFKPEDLKQVMQEYDMTEAEINSEDSDIYPYFSVKTVLVDDGGLKVGYFEIVPASILD